VTTAFTDLDGLVDRIPDGAIVAMPQERAGGCAMALVRRAIQRGVRGLRLVGAQGGGIQVELLISAGCVDTVDGVDVTSSGFAGMPNAMRTAGNCPVTAADASRSTQIADLAVFHAGKVDRVGNVCISGMRHLRTLTHSAQSIVVSYEECVEEDLMADTSGVADTIPAAQVAALAKAPLGSWPLGLSGYYEADRDHLALYAKFATTEDGFQAYLRNHIYQRLAVD